MKQHNKLLNRGSLTELLKQPQYTPLPVEYQILLFMLVLMDILDNLRLSKVLDSKHALYKFVDTKFNL